MENASKALILAAGMLLGIMILSLTVYLFSTSSKLSQSYEESLQKDAINNFNNKFIECAKDITAQEMVTLINMIKENNEKYASEPQRQIILTIDNRQVNVATLTEEWKINIMKSEVPNTDPTYSFLAIEYWNNGYIKALKYKT